VSFRDLADGVNQAVVGTFGEPSDSLVVYTAAGESAGVEVAAVFDAAGRRVEVSEGVAMESVAPRLFIRRAALSFTPGQGDRWTAYGVTYAVTYADPDGYGGWLLTGKRV
jgi:hypothetical protein